MPESLSAGDIFTAVGGPIGAIATSITQTAVDAARAWIQDHLGKHGAETRRRAEENAAGYVRRLASRVQRIEQQLRGRGSLEEEIFHHLTDPDFAATLQTALIASARTANREKHEILADLVAERLQAAAESEEAVIATVAVEVVPRLAARHLDVLGLLTLLNAIGLEYPTELSETERAEAAHRDTESLLGRFTFEAAAPALRWNLVHLTSLGCLRYSSLSVRTLTQTVIFRELLGPSTTDAQIESLLALGEHGRRLVARWNDVLAQASPTPVGRSIGVAVYRARLRQAQ